MPSSEYASAIGGGLKLKGSSTGAGIDKKKKKKKVKRENEDDVKGKESQASTATTANLDGSMTVAPKGDTVLPASSARDDRQVEQSVSDRPEDDDDEGLHSASYKTEAQRRHEERRRKRLDERLKREGVQTHKERVEQLNKYLSGLSEHHDMPRIGPG